jgi:ribonucleoside-diphosphate reductase alpha chain
MMDNPDLLFDEEIQQEAAKSILDINKKIATMLGINPCARATCVKPAGSTSCVLGTASGIHPHHAKRYVRRVQANKSEFCLKETEKRNPAAVEESVWSTNKTDKVISFLCEVPVGAIVKNQLKAVELLERVRTTQQNWVDHGTVIERCVNPKARHNVSNTITVKPDEWEDVENFIFDNQQWFAGISLLPSSGDLDYAQAPFATVLTPSELVKEYGDASVFASGLIVDGLAAFDNNLWRACDTVLGFGEDLTKGHGWIKPVYPTVKRTNKALAEYFLETESYDEWFNKVDWVRRVKQFGDRYFDGDVKRATYCLKHVSLWKTWCDLKREYVELDWTQITEDHESHVDADTLGAQACSGTGTCELM